MIAIVGWAVLAAWAVFIVIGSIIFIRQMVARGQGVIHIALGLLFNVIGVGYFLWEGFSPFHVLWITPLSFIIGFIGLFVPPLRFIGILISAICAVGAASGDRFDQ